MVFNYKSVTDPLYGYVGLSEVEAAVVSSTVFQRLHNVRQLGLAHLVFPTAGYSRFAHSVGACHNAGRIIDAINENGNTSISAKKKQIYRLAALLHDVGHYPFSHATEHMVLSFYVGSSLLDFGGVGTASVTPLEGVNHEVVGRLIIENDPELDKIFSKYKISKNDLLKVFSKKDPDTLFGIISSDLDCDRLDYLKRTAHAAGVPYGEVDIDFIISKATVDKDRILCFQSKAATAIDHFLVSRFYDYMQVVFHKTVVGLEWSLVVLIEELLERNILEAHKAEIISKIESQHWAQFDDNFVLAKLKELMDSLSGSAGTHVLCDHLRAVLYRKPAKLVYAWDAILPKDDPQISMRKIILETKIVEIASEMGIDSRRFKLDVRRPFPFSSDLGKPASELRADEQARSVSVLDKGRRKSRLLVESRDCLISVLSTFHSYGLKVLYLPRDGEEKSVRDEIRKRLAEISFF